MSDTNFPDGAALIFGGSGGIGRGVALEFARSGSDVAIAFRSKRDVAEATAEEIRGLGRRASVHSLDVRDIDQVMEVSVAAADAHKRLHSIIWAVGPVVDQVFLSNVTHEQWRLAVDIEVHGFFNVVKATLPHLRTQGGGCYVTVGTAGHLRWPSREVLSVAPKGANEQLVRAIAKEEGRFNIRANSVLAGVIEAGMFLELTQSGELDQNWVEAAQKMLALKRWGTPADIGNAVAFLASDKAAYVTGEQLTVAGGSQL